MTEQLTSCSADPNFAVICSFLQRFAEPCGISHPNFLELQEMLENTEQVPQPLIDLHVKLLRKARKSVSLERWERAVVKFCHTHASVDQQKDGWDIERLGYVNLCVDGKLRVLKLLLEHQFDLNSKFKAEVNRQSSAELRLQPFGRDKLGQNYWLQQDEFCNLKVYREDADNETWEVVASDRQSLVELINKLSEGNLESVFNSDDSNSQEANENIDTGQCGEDTKSPKPHEKNGAKNARDDKNPLNEAEKNSPTLHALSGDDTKTTQDSPVNDQSNESVVSAYQKSIKKEEEQFEGVSKQEDQLKLSSKESPIDSLDENKSQLNQLKIEPTEEEPKELDTCQDAKEACKTDDLEGTSNKRKVNDLVNAPGSSDIVEQEIKRKKCEDTAVSDAIEEKTLYVSGEGSGKDCELGNPVSSLQLPDVSEAIEEPVMYFYGIGSGSECETGNPDNSDDAEKSNTTGESGKLVKKLEEEAVSSTNGSLDDVSNRKPSADENFQDDDSAIDFLKTGFFFGPGTLAAKDKIPMGSLDEEEPVKSINKTMDLGSGEGNVSEMTPSVSSQEKEATEEVESTSENVQHNTNPDPVNSTKVETIVEEVSKSVTSMSSQDSCVPIDSEGIPDSLSEKMPESCLNEEPSASKIHITANSSSLEDQNSLKETKEYLHSVSEKQSNEIKVVESASPDTASTSEACPAQPDVQTDNSSVQGRSFEEDAILDSVESARKVEQPNAQKTLENSSSLEVVQRSEISVEETVGVPQESCKHQETPVSCESLPQPERKSASNSLESTPVEYPIKSIESQAGTDTAPDQASDKSVADETCEATKESSSEKPSTSSEAEAEATISSSQIALKPSIKVSEEVNIADEVETVQILPTIEASDQCKGDEEESVSSLLESGEKSVMDNIIEKAVEINEKPEAPCSSYEPEEKTKCDPENVSPLIVVQKKPPSTVSISDAQLDKVEAPLMVTIDKLQSEPEKSEEMRISAQTEHVIEKKPPSTVSVTDVQLDKVDAPLMATIEKLQSEPEKSEETRISAQTEHVIEKKPPSTILVSDVQLDKVDAPLMATIEKLQSEPEKSEETRISAQTEHVIEKKPPSTILVSDVQLDKVDAPLMATIGKLQSESEKSEETRISAETEHTAASETSVESSSLLIESSESLARSTDMAEPVSESPDDKQSIDVPALNSEKMKTSLPTHDSCISHEETPVVPSSNVEFTVDSKSEASSLQESCAQADTYTMDYKTGSTEDERSKRVSSTETVEVSAMAIVEGGKDSVSCVSSGATLEVSIPSESKTSDETHTLPMKTEVEESSDTESVNPLLIKTVSEQETAPISPHIVTKEDALSDSAASVANIVEANIDAGANLLEEPKVDSNITDTSEDPSSFKHVSEGSLPVETMPVVETPVQPRNIAVDDKSTTPLVANIGESAPTSTTSAPSSCSEEVCLDDDPPAITTLEDAMRQMEAAGAPVCLDDSDDGDDDGHFEEGTEHAEEKPEEEEEEEEKSFFVFEGSIGGWKHATTGRKDEENKNECEDDMFSDLAPLASPPMAAHQTPGQGDEKKSEEGVQSSPRKGTRSSRRRGGLEPVEGVEVSQEQGEDKDDSATERDPLAVSDEDSKGKNARSQRGRKRRNSDPLESPEALDAEAESKRAKLRGKRPLDPNLRLSVEEQRAGLVDASSEDVDEAADDPLRDSEDEHPASSQASRRGGWRGGRRGRGRRGWRGRGRVASAGATRQDIASTENADVGEEGSEKSESPEKAEKKPPGKRKNRMLAELQVDLNVLNSETTEEGRGVRTSRRIAQIRLKEQAERREIEEAEMSLKERYKLEKEARKAAKLEKRRQRKEKAADSDFEGGRKRKKKKHKKEKQPKFNESTKVWNETSSGSSSSSDSVEDEIPEPSDDDVPYVVKSDHEFSPESDVNDEEYQPTRRARTARRDKEAEAEPEPDYPCKKCGKSDQPEWMLLCDKCDAGWHCSCLRPALLQIPEGDWLCPPCQHTQLITCLQEHLQSYDVDMKRLASEEARRKFMSFVDISVENILPGDSMEKVKKKKKKMKHRERKRGKLRRCQIIDSSDDDNDQGVEEDDSEEEADDSKKDPDAEDDSDVSSSSESFSGTSTSESSSSSSSSLAQSSDGSEPIYQLRQRRQTNVNYRFNEYDDLIKSAIQDGIETVGEEAEVPVADVAPDVENLPPVKTVQSAGKRLEGEDEISDEEEIQMKKPQRRGKYLTDEEEEEEPEAKVDEEEEDEEEEEVEGYVPPVVKKSTVKGKRKKHKPLTALDVSSTSSDPESDEDFKGSTDEDEEGDESYGSMSDSDDSVIRSRRRGGPVRRSGRNSNRMTRYDRDFIDDSDADYSDDSDAPRKKKTRKQSSERRAAKRGRAQTKSKAKKTKKKARKINDDDSDKEVRIKKVKPKPTKQVKSGSESDTPTPAPRRTRGRVMDYRENDSSEDEAAAKKASKLKELKDSKEVADSPETNEDTEVIVAKSEKPRTHPRMKVTPLRSTSAVSITPSSAVKGEISSSDAPPAVSITPTTKKSPAPSSVSPAQSKTPSRVVAPGIPPSVSAVPINPETKVPVGVSQTGIRTIQQLVGGESTSSPTGGSQTESPTGQPQSQPQTRVPPTGVPQTMPQGVAPVVPQGLPQQIVTQSGGVLQSVPQGVSLPQGVAQGMAPGVPSQSVPQVMPPTTYPASASGPLMAMQALAGEGTYPYQHYYHQPPPHAPYLPNPHHHPSPHHPAPHHHTSPHHAPHHPAPHHPAPHHPSPHHASPHMMTPHHPNLSPHHSRPHHHLSGHHPPHPHHAYTNPAQHALAQQHVGLHSGPQGSPPSNPANPSGPQPPAKYEEEGRSEFGGLVSYFSSQHDDMEG